MSDKRVDRLRYLGLHCTKLRDENWRDEFSMRVPAEEDRDAGQHDQRRERGGDDDPIEHAVASVRGGRGLEVSAFLDIGL